MNFALFASETIRHVTLLLCI